MTNRRSQLFINLISSDRLVKKVFNKKMKLKKTFDSKSNNKKSQKISKKLF